jgi:thiol:disulfide interchange protein DsbD
MLYFWQKRCPSCDELKEKTFTDPQIVELSEQFTTLSIDGTQSGDPQIREMLREYGVYGFPTIIFLDSDGNVVKDRTLIGFVPPEDLMENMLAIMANEEN